VILSTFWGLEGGLRGLGACCGVHEAELKLSPTEDNPTPHDW